MLLLVPDAEERCLENEDAPVEDKLAVESHEECREEHPDVESVDIGIGREDDLAVAKVLERVLDVERLDEVEELLVLVKDVLVEPASVEALAAQEEDRLVHRVTRAAERTARGLTLGEEDHRVLALGLAGLLVDLVELQVVLAVLELRDAHRDGLGPLARLLLYRVELRADLPRLLDFGDELVGLGRRAVESGLDLLLHLLDELGLDVVHHELDLRLSFEDRVHDPHRHRAEKAVANVITVELLLRVVVVERLGERLLERREVRAAIGRVLAVDERVVFLAEAIGVREDYLERLRLHVERLVELLELRLVSDEVREPAVGADLLAVQDNRQPRVHVAVHLHAPEDVFLAHLELLQHLEVGLVADVCSRVLVGLELAALLGLEPPFLEIRLGELSLAEAPHFEKL